MIQEGTLFPDDPTSDVLYKMSEKRFFKASLHIQIQCTGEYDRRLMDQVIEVDSPQKKIWSAQG